MTSALDMYWFHEAAERVAREAGWRLLTGPTFMDVPGSPDGRPYGERLEWARRDLAARTADRPGTRPVLFAHSAYTLGPEQLVEIAALAREFGALLHIHAAENAAEVETVEQRYGKRRWNCSTRSVCSAPICCWPTRRLTGPEITALGRTGTSVAHCLVNLKRAAGSHPCRGCWTGGDVGLGRTGR